MTKFKRNKVKYVIVKKDQIKRIIEYMNSLESMLDFIRTTDDICLSDVREMGSLIKYMSDTFNLEVDVLSSSHTTQWKRKEEVETIGND